MNLMDKIPIYSKIYENILENILSGQWKENDKIPSIRDLALLAEVNPNTVMKSVSKLIDMEILENKRGIGIFVKEGAYEKVLNIKRREFFDVLLPMVIKRAKILNIDIVSEIKKYL
ncbi:MAG: GntR family transcriptional regulator [Spirochaetes bacterium]|nr:GntR family transcriptional regulator [Spirochaetota bacterium]